jgi:hypothetical protein
MQRWGGEPVHSGKYTRVSHRWSVRIRREEVRARRGSSERPVVLKSRSILRTLYVCVLVRKTNVRLAGRVELCGVGSGRVVQDTKKAFFRTLVMRRSASSPGSPSPATGAAASSSSPSPSTAAKTQSKLFSFFTKIPTTKAAAAAPPTAPSPSEKLHKNQEENKTVQNYVVLVTLVPLLCSPLLVLTLAGSMRTAQL